MSFTLGTNISSLKAQGQLSGLKRAQGRVYERLASGQRINRSSDDAAGLAVSLKLSSRERVLGRASLNISDATSLLNMASSALEQVSLLAQRMSELATQGASGGLSKTQRRTLDDEFKALSSEISRITGSTNFNDIKVFDGERVAPTGQTVASSGGFFESVTSATGRFTATRGLSNHYLYDSISGGLVQFHPGALSAGSLRVLDNGDVFFRDGGDGQIKRFNYQTQTLQTITNEASSSTFNGVYDVSADGSTIAFLSTTQYADGGTIASASGTGARKLYALDIEKGIIRASSSTGMSASSTLRISEDGFRLALLEPLAIGPASHTLSTASLNESGLSALGGSVFADQARLYGISNDGRVLISKLASTGVVIEGGDFVLLEPLAQIFSLNVGGGETQLTNFASSINFSTLKVSIDPRLSQFHLISSQNITGDNPFAVNQVFRLDISSQDFSQVTRYTSAALSVPASISISGDGRILRQLRSSTIDEHLIMPDNRTVSFSAGESAEATGVTGYILPGISRSSP
jgi:flagellin